MGVIQNSVNQALALGAHFTGQMNQSLASSDIKSGEDAKQAFEAGNKKDRLGRTAIEGGSSNVPVNDPSNTILGHMKNIEANKKYVKGIKSDIETTSQLRGEQAEAKRQQLKDIQNRNRDKGIRKQAMQRLGSLLKGSLSIKQGFQEFREAPRDYSSPASYEDSYNSMIRGGDR